MATRVEVLCLYRAMLRQAARFSDYNFRAHAKRRIANEFHSKRSLAQAHDVLASVTRGREQLGLLQRQALMSRLYPESKSIMQDS